MILLEEYIQKLGKIEQQILDGMIPIAEEAALNAKALAVRRIQSQGVGEYSENKLPYYFFTEEGGEPDLDKTKSNAGINFIKQVGKDKEKRKAGITWAELRDAEGLQTDFVDLTFTGEMFRDLNVLGVNVQGQKVVAILGTSRTETINKLKWNAARYGSFMDLTQDEKRQVQAIIQKRMAALLKKVITP